MRQRGAALLVVLGLVSTVLFIGLMMGSLSTLSLQFNRRQLEGIRAEMAARSALANLLAELSKLDDATPLNPLDPKPIEVAKSFPKGLITKEGQYTVTITFDATEKGYSTDNLSGDAPSIGWPDSVDEVPRVAPFGLDVILNVEGPSTHHRYRAGLRRVWPYALYAARGPIVLMAQPDLMAPNPFPFPSRVKGDVFTTWKGNATNGGTKTIGYGLGILDQPSKLLAYIEARNGYHPAELPQNPLIVGMTLGYNEPIKPVSLHPDSTSAEQFFRYVHSDLPASWKVNSDDPTFASPNINRSDRGNRLFGNLYYCHDVEGYEVVPSVLDQDDSLMFGKAIKRRELTADPLAEISPDSGPGASTFQGVGFAKLSLPPTGPELERKYGFEFEPENVVHHDREFQDTPPYLLEDDLILTDTTNSTGGAISAHYEIDGSLSNRQVLYHEGNGSLYVRQVRKGIHLQGTVLHVKGNLDLSSIDPDGPGGLEVDPVTVIGSGATLIVDGQLILGNALINAQDQGFVLYAKDIVLKGGGDFRGLMIAENSISILTQNERALNIKGALLCAGDGGITLVGGTLEHDPQYLKGINGGGDFQILSWKKL